MAAHNANKTSFKKGQQGLGRPPGTPNKLTTTIREAVLDAFNELQNDPQVKLVVWGKKNPTEFYQIAARLIPTEINATLQKRTIVVLSEGDNNKKIPEAEILEE